MDKWAAAMLLAVAICSNAAGADRSAMQTGGTPMASQQAGTGSSGLGDAPGSGTVGQKPGQGNPTARRPAVSPSAIDADPCAGWPYQQGPESDTTGLANTNYPEASSTTYWVTLVDASPGAVLIMRGRFPFGRFMGLEIYSGDQLVDHLSDVDIAPDHGENNPYVSGTANGTYTAHLVFGDKPQNPAPNTIYAGSLTSVALMYRIYHSTDPSDPTGGARNPVLPDITLDGVSIPTCPAHGFVADLESTVWGRLDNADWTGTPPGRRLRLSAVDPPLWRLTDPYDAHYYPNGANHYMSAMLSREFLAPYTNKNLYVVRFKAPTFPDTRRGEPVHLDRQVHFWSMCTNEPYTTNVNRCIPDDQTLLDEDGFATFVVSDPGVKPSDAALAMFKANWIAWGALGLRGDVVYDRDQRPWGSRTPVHFYSGLLYRQTVANATFTQSFRAVAQLPKRIRQAAMGDFWPIGGYCSTVDFNAFGVSCLTR